LPSTPSNKDYTSPVFLALIVGLALGVGLAFARERLDERVTDRDHFEAALGAPILAIVPRVPGWRNRNEAKLVSVSAPDGAASEAYRTARTTLLYLAREGGLNVIAITGPGQGEGKTTTTGNLAVSLAQIGKRVVMISCDLRKPRLHRFFGLQNEVGLADVLMGLIDVPGALFKTQVPGLLLMPSGHTPHNPAELLASDAMDSLIDELSKVADYVILDTAPALVVADALGLAPKVDGVIVVAEAQKSHRSSLEYMAAQLQRSGGQLIGGILNNLDPSISKKYGSYGKYYKNYYPGAERYKLANDRGHGKQAPQAESQTNGKAYSANGNGSIGQANGSHKKQRRLLSKGRKSTEPSQSPPDPQSWS
jgi:capsular exopolysaccharide synthesis family protein